MLTVYKYPIYAGLGAVSMPIDASVVSVFFEAQPLNGEKGGVFLYALVDTGQENTEVRQFIMEGTGNPFVIPEGDELGNFIGTVTNNGYYFHIFEVWFDAA